MCSQYLISLQLHIVTCVFPGGVDVVDVTQFGGGSSGSIFLDRLQCNGEEASILDCSHPEIHMCSHHDDVGIICHCKIIYCVPAIKLFLHLM